MVSTYICPLCGSHMFHDKGNHIIFCAECDHVGWPHDTSVPQDEPPKDAPPNTSKDSVTNANVAWQKETTTTH